MITSVPISNKLGFPQGRNGLCANWDIHPREQGDSPN